MASAIPGRIKVFAGNAWAGATEGENGVGRLRSPWGFAKSSNGNIYVAGEHFISEIDANKSISLFAGSGNDGDTNGQRLAAAFETPKYIAFDTNGDMYISDSENHKIKKIDMSTGVVSTFAGSTGGFTDALATAAQFDTPAGLVFDANNNLYVADSENQSIRKIDTAGNVTTVAENGVNSNVIGSELGDMEIYQSEIYFADKTNHSIKKLNLSSSTVTTVAGTGVSGDALGNPLTTAQFTNPEGIAIDSDGDIYISDYSTNKLYFLDTTLNEVKL